MTSTHLLSLQNLPKDTCRLSLGLHIQVLYASVGALAIPQSKILGVALLYDNIRDVKFRVRHRRIDKVCI